MYKIKIMNYKNYEYELLQNELNQLSQQGYEIKNIHWLTLLKKTDQKYQYIVKLFHPEGKSHFDKNISKQKFLDYYLDQEYQMLFQKKNLYVLKGTNPIKSQFSKNPVTNKDISQSILYCLSMIALSIFFFFNSQQSMTFDFLSSYGLTFTYIGILLLFLTLTYQSATKTFYLIKLKNCFENKKSYIQKNILKIHHNIYTFLLIVSIIFMVGGTIEDYFNAESISIQDHPMLNLQQLQITQDTIQSYKKHSGFQIPQYYHYLEYTQDEKYILQVKEYIMNSKNDAQEIWNELASKPEQYQCDTIKQENNVIYGYTEKKLTSLIIVNNEHVYSISINFDLTKQQVHTILKQYQ